MSNNKQNGLNALKEYRDKIKSGLISPPVKRKRYSMAKGIKEKCSDCMSEYMDGRNDCGVDSCSLYPFMPYGKIRRGTE